MTMTPDEAAIEIMLDGRLTAAQRDAKLTRLYRAVTDAVECRVPCPDCGHRGPHDHNGDRLDPQLCCAGCGAHFNEPEVRF